MTTTVDRPTMDIEDLDKGSKWVVIVDVPIFTAFGPFDTAEAASTWADRELKALAKVVAPLHEPS